MGSMLGIFERSLRYLRKKMELHRRLELLRHRMPKEAILVYQKYRQHPESKHIFGELDATILYEQVRKYRPKHCIELGCGLGTATAIVTMAMEANGSGRVTSLEHLDWMVKLASEMLPEACGRRVEIVRCDTEIRHYFGENWICYKFVPSTADIDFVIVDGPPTEWKDDTGNLIRLPCGDLVGFIPYLQPGCRIFIDGRVETVEALRRHLADTFKMRQSRMHYTLVELRPKSEGERRCSSP